MKGSVRKRYNNAWSYRIDLGFVDGKRKQVEKGGFKTEREATKAMQDVLYHLNNTGDYVENKKFEDELKEQLRKISVKQKIMLLRFIRSERETECSSEPAAFSQN